MAEFGSAEEEIQEADEINALYEAPREPVAVEEGMDASFPHEVPTIDFRGHFPEHMDASVWGLIQPLLLQGIADEDIARGSLSCPLDVGIAYLGHLRQKYQETGTW